MGSQVATEHSIEQGRGDIFGTPLLELLETSIGFALELTIAAGQLLRRLVEALILSFHILEPARELTDAQLAFIKTVLLALGFTFEFRDLFAHRRKISYTAAVVSSGRREWKNHRAQRHQAL